MERPTPRRVTRFFVVAVLGATALYVASVGSPTNVVLAVDTRVPAGQVYRIPVPDAIGGKTVIGQLTVDNATAQGYVTAYGCDDGIPLDADGNVAKSDLNYDGAVSGVWSNRLIVQADSDGDICLYTKSSVDMIVDVNGISFDTGITSFQNRRVDTRTGANTERKPVAAGGVLRVPVPEAVGGRTVIGQLTTDRANDVGYVTAFGCDFGLPTGARGAVSKSDLNFDDDVSPARSNRLIVQADDHGDVCFHSSHEIELIIDLNGVTDDGFTSFANRRTDTRRAGGGQVGALGAEQVLRISVPESIGGKTVIGQLTVDRAATSGFVTAYGCDDELPREAGDVVRSDLNYDGRVAAIWSNRLIVQADADGDVCFYTSGVVDVIVDINGVATDIGIFSFPNQRTDTRTGSRAPVTSVPVDAGGTPVWPPFTPATTAMTVGALTGEPVGAKVAARPILAVKVDNFRRARPQFGLERADAIIEENVEGVTRFIALYQTRLPVDVGPVRSARTGDLDLLSGMNRPVFAYSGANVGVTTWIRSAADSGVLVDFSGLRSPCYSREPTRPAPHDLVIDSACAVAASMDRSTAPGRAGAMWAIDGTWKVPAAVRPVRDTTFTVVMDGVRVGWTWNPTPGNYVRSQDGVAHTTESGARISARNVVEIFATHVPSPVDTRSPNPITVGDGGAVIHRAGVAIRGTWSRETAFDPFVFRDASTGAIVPLDTGTTFIELTRAT